MLAQENLLEIAVTWAVKGRPAAVEEQLHKEYEEKFGKLPEHTEPPRFAEQ